MASAVAPAWVKVTKLQQTLHPQRRSPPTEREVPGGALWSGWRILHQPGHQAASSNKSCVSRGQRFPRCTIRTPLHPASKVRCCCRCSLLPIALFPTVSRTLDGFLDLVHPPGQLQSRSMHRLASFLPSVTMSACHGSSPASLTPSSPCFEGVNRGFSLSRGLRAGC